MSTTFENDAILKEEHQVDADEFTDETSNLIKSNKAHEITLFYIYNRYAILKEGQQNNSLAIANRLGYLQSLSNVNVFFYCRKYDLQNTDPFCGTVEKKLPRSNRLNLPRFYRSILGYDHMSKHIVDILKNPIYNPFEPLSCGNRSLAVLFWYHDVFDINIHFISSVLMNHEQI